MKYRFTKHLRNYTQEPILNRYSNLTEEEATLEKLLEFQKDALHANVAQAYKNPFYFEKMKEAGVKPQDIKTLTDLAKLPFTTKEELRRDPWQLLATDKRDISLVHVSTGTTGGEEIYMMQSWRDLYLNEFSAGYPHLLKLVPGDICINALPYEMSSSGLAFHKVFMEISGVTVVPVGKGGAYSTPRKTVQVMKDLQPTVVMTTPSYSITLAEAAAEMDFDLASLNLKKVWLTGEGCSPAFRERVEKIWGTITNFYYGSLEAMGLGIECDYHAGYHIPMGHVIIEIIDPETGEVLEPGEIGEIVTTPLLRFDTPLLRYRTQDLGYIDPEPCECGMTFPRFFMRGRTVDQVTIQGIGFSPFYLEEFLMRLPEVGNWYQFVVQPEDNDHLKIRTELAPGVEPTPELADRLASKMEYSLGIPCEFEFLPKLMRTGAKSIRVVRD
ncbi:coenzyme F390 synthetase [Desulfitobacterium dichloroeliminans LMG P-21439]|uniref:Coenzyme F390 synthetase n=1 Tax=Desulfitobacterium dichloroeliminans (strain LMG P-21439 / DCA1) TaxID=871963 RepID=L0FB37_DESDL|nr:AMP-binding protein [Desulfitobacterium dichloroeliminans]AGA70442.1 coenzyme F390 synthetase [Desulfitobacterium dichloroeliminans LMG P-21439]